MQARSAVIMSLGFFQEDVNHKQFVGTIIKQAIDEHSDFTLTPEIFGAALKIATDFNQGVYDKAEDFRSAFLKIFCIEQMSQESFWAAWNDMVKVGILFQNLSALKAECAELNVTLYLNSDTNVKHMELRAVQALKQSISMDLKTNPTQLLEIPLYTSYQNKASRLELLKKIVADIQKQFFAPATIKIVLGNPAEIKDPNVKKQAEAEVKLITEWADAENILLLFHSKGQKMVDTLTQNTQSESTKSFVRRNAFSC